MPKVLSLFSGCGGFDLGFRQAGFQISDAFDLDPVAIATYNSNFRRQATLRDLALGELKPIYKPDVVIAGPPCQGFSTIGKMNRDDQRNDLFVKSCQIAVSTRPKVIVIENVPAIASSKFGAILEEALQTLREANYYVQCKIIAGEELGLAQRRRRFFLVGRELNAPFEIRFRKRPSSTVSDALKGLANISKIDSKEFALSRDYQRIAERIGPGQKLCNVRSGENSVHTWDIPEVFGTVDLVEKEILESILILRRTERSRNFGDADPVAYHRLKKTIGHDCKRSISSLIRKGYLKMCEDKLDLTHTFNGMFRRLDRNGLSPTVDTHFGNPRLFLHPRKHRGLTHIEAARLQGFPDDFNWPSATQTRFRLIGNAVPPPISRSFANLAKSLIA
jgi:DNA (cytosine-5)-methyltransferase 1